MTKKKTLLSWSSGKDSAWSLHALRQDPAIDLRGLFTVVNEAYSRASMHATRVELLHRQADAAGLPLVIISLPDKCTMERSDEIMGAFTAKARADGIECMAFGDLYLEDVRKYREGRLKGSGIEPIFPLWGIPTRALASQMLASGMQTYLSCVDPRKIPRELAGALWTKALIDSLPEGVDPCGENGEFHSIVVAGPFFSKPIVVRVGEIVEREGFVFADIVPEN